MKRSRNKLICVIHWPNSNGLNFTELTPQRLEKLQKRKEFTRIKHNGISTDKAL